MGTVVKRGSIISVWIVLLQTLSVSQSKQPCMTVEFHLAEAKAAKGLTKAIVPSTNESVYLHRAIIFTNKDILNARAEKYTDLLSGKTRNHVDVTLTKEAAGRMARITQENRGRMLVILVDGDVVAASRMWETITDRFVINDDQMATDAAERIAKWLSSKCIAQNDRWRVLTGASAN